MRKIVLHRRADRYLDRMPRARQAQVVVALEEVANLEDIQQHPNITALSGRLSGWHRLRTGSYRSILQLRLVKEADGTILYVDYIGPRGDAYRS